MKKLIKCSVVFVLIASVLLATSSFAFATTIPNPLEITFTTNKSKYAAYGVAEVTVVIKNVSEITLNNVIAEAMFDQLLPLGRYSTFVAADTSLEPGETLKLKYKVALNKNEVAIKGFQKSTLNFILLFYKKMAVTNSPYDLRRVYINSEAPMLFGSFNVTNNVRVSFDTIPDISIDIGDIV